MSAAGGLALFLLAMAMMTDGLKVFGGQGLKILLRDWTSSAIRGALSGALITAIVQSSSAVTVATIGFVNAGVLSLRRALGVIFGSNVGTTMTGWLVSLVGFGFKIEAFALPILAVGVATRLIAPGKRIQGLGNALAGFGLFFLGLAILKESFAGLAATYGNTLVAGSGIIGVLTYVGFGFLATVLTQSSSAAIAIIITAAVESVISVDAAAAAIIGANIGTTSTAMLAVIGATPSAKRVAAGHLAFNVVTGLVALLILPAVLAAISLVSKQAGLSGHPAPLLALFHTTFNVLGVALMLPFSDRLANLLERLFRSEEEDLSKPQHLDKTVLATPSLAVTALRNELLRLQGIVCRLALEVLRSTGAKPEYVRRRSEAAYSLCEAIEEFATSIQMESLPRTVAEDLPRALRTARYLEEAARLTPDAETLRHDVLLLRHETTRTVVERALGIAVICIELAVKGDGSAEVQSEKLEALAAFEEAYQEAKSALLAAAATRALGVAKVEIMLDSLSRSRRMVEQIFKADQLLHLPPNSGESELPETE